jgi:hypothetical protein
MSLILPRSRTRLIIPRHAWQQCHERINRSLDLRRAVLPYLESLDQLVPVKGRVAWMDAPGGMVPVLERSSRRGAIVVVTILGKDYGLSSRTRAIYLGVLRRNSRNGC